MHWGPEQSQKVEEEDLLFLTDGLSGDPQLVMTPSALQALRPPDSGWTCVTCAPASPGGREKATGLPSLHARKKPLEIP